MSQLSDMGIKAVFRQEGFDVLSVVHADGARIEFSCPCGRVERAFTRTGFSEAQIRLALRRHLSDFQDREHGAQKENPT